CLDGSLFIEDKFLSLGDRFLSPVQAGSQSNLYPIDTCLMMLKDGEKLASVDATFSVQLIDDLNATI
ncbi:hypothetical protein ACLOJK_028206, partial [Asimina triloba]